MDYRILGHLEVLQDGRPLALGSAKQRALLAALLIRPNQIVATDTLIGDVWGPDASPTAANNLQVLVSRLRKLLGHETIVRRGAGYLIRVPDRELDVHEFERLRQDGKLALERGDDAAAAALLRDALDLWRGPALADFVYEPFAEQEIARLEELRLATLEDRVAADLDVGRHRDLVPELERLVAEHPYRERFRAQLILALYRCGRQADALEAYRSARRTLSDELGIEPGPELRALERRVLTQDPTLDLAQPHGDGRGRWMSRRAGVFAGGLAVAVLGIGIAVGRGDEDRAVAVQPNSLAVIDVARNRVVADLPLSIEPNLVAANGRSVWASAAHTNAIVRVDPTSRRIAQTYGVGGGPAVGLAADADGAWVASAPARTRVLVERYEPRSAGATRSIELIERTLFGAHRYVPLAIAGGSLWATNGETVLSKIEARSGTVVRRIVVDEGAGPLAVGAGDVWTTYTLSDSVTRIDGARARPKLTITLARPQTEPVRGGHTRRGAIDPAALLYAFGSIWVSGHGIGAVLRIDPETNAVMSAVQVAARPGALAASGDAVWVLDGEGVARVDPRRNAVVGRIPLGRNASGIAYADGHVWVAIGR